MYGAFTPAWVAASLLDLMLFLRLVQAHSNSVAACLSVIGSSFVFFILVLELGCWLGLMFGVCAVVPPDWLLMDDSIIL